MDLPEDGLDPLTEDPEFCFRPGPIMVECDPEVGRDLGMDAPDLDLWLDDALFGRGESLCTAELGRLPVGVGEGSADC